MGRGRWVDQASKRKVKWGEARERDMGRNREKGAVEGWMEQEGDRGWCQGRF